LKRRTILTGLASLAATPALGQTQGASAAPVSSAETPDPVPPAPAVAPSAPASPAAPAELAPPAPGKVRVNMTTPHGLIVIDLENEKAPISARNFLRYVDGRLFDGAKFYRASRTRGFEDSMGMLQGGREPAFARIAHEPTTKTGLSHTDGAVSLGRYAPGSAAADFFICLGDQTGLDADPTQPGDNLGFAVFGYVVQGMDVVKKILAMNRSPTKGVGHMKGEMLDPPVPITRVRRA